MLTEVRDSLQKALDEGKPFEEWKKEIVPKLEGKWLGRSVGELWDELSDEEKAKREPPSEKQREKIIAPERLELIFRTNMAVANAAGHYEQLMKTKAIYPYWRYVTRDDARVRDAHRALHNKVFKWDDPFWETYFPPNGFRCRCHVSPLTKRQVERDPKLHIEQSNIAEDADGRKVLDLGGTLYKNNPGWDYNPGDSVSHLVSLAKSNEKGRPAQVQADLEADLAKKEAEEAAAAKAKAETEEQRKAEEARRAEEAEKARLEAERKAQEIERRLQEAQAKAEQRKAEREAQKAERQIKEAEAKTKAAEAEKQRQAEETEKARLEAEKKAQEEAQSKTQEEVKHKTKEEAAKEAEHQAKEAKAKAKATAEKQHISFKKNPTVSLLPGGKAENVQNDNLKPNDKHIETINTLSVSPSISITDEKTRSQAIDIIVGTVSKHPNGNDKKYRNANGFEKAIRDKASQATPDELQIIVSALTQANIKYCFYHDGEGGAGFYHKEPKKVGVNIDTWNVERNEMWLNPKGNADTLALGHELMHIADWLAGEISQDGTERIPATALPLLKHKLYKAAMADIKKFMTAASGHDLPDFDITNPDDEIISSYQRYLLKYYNKSELKIYIQTLTDAVGLYSKGKLMPPETPISLLDVLKFKRDNINFIVHNQDFFDELSKLESINPDIYIDAGNSELLAGIFGAQIRKHDKMTSYIGSIFPIAMNEYNSIISIIAQRLKQQPSRYEFAEAISMSESKRMSLKELEEYSKRIINERTPEEIAIQEEYYRKMAPFWAAEKKYQEAGLGRLMTTFWDYAPPAAKNYPGGATAVYEEAVKRGVTWQEVCGYVPPPYITGFTD